MQPLSIWRDLPYHTVIHIFIVVQSVLVGAGRWLDRLHDICHSYASRALAAGESLSMIGKLLGHADIQSTARYAHLARETERLSAARVGGSIGADIGAAGTANKDSPSS